MLSFFPTTAIETENPTLYPTLYPTAPTENPTLSPTGGHPGGLWTITDSNINVAADGWKKDMDPDDWYGPIVDWDVSAVTSMYEGAL